MRLNKKLETQLNLYKEFNENQILLHELNKALKQRDQYKTERDTLIDDLTWYKAKVERLEHENKRLTRLTHKLTNHRIMWDNLKDWRKDMLEIDKNDTQLIGLGLVMDDLEKDWLYKEENNEQTNI
ncbi:hypothetical protein SAR03_18550 [Staphylococcus arlettae]|uniref:Uncharacterized protein n=1 Tax=Staphylococcus arlettae TaxID=29378 RepID=A0A380CDB4_9STAP|nr:hypothetical protein [Staphylococcus arlettae]PNZ55617.1 hypothetical protein CD036_00210 [Staphylococcus arlettae]GEQ00818.1 hypothetical protein SAR03_18550 [Staphylococcus arlettae]SUJ16743.1 Uncharacterised protein [Staphylococcus arlettae]